MDAAPEWFYATTGGTYRMDRLGTDKIFEDERVRAENCEIRNSSGNIVTHRFGSTLTVIGSNASPNCPSPNQHEGELNTRQQGDIDLCIAAGKDYRGSSHDNVGVNAGRTNWNFNSDQFGLMDTDLSWYLPTKEPCMITSFTYYESLKAYSTAMHGRTPAAISVGNVSASPQTGPVYAAVMDMWGGESDSHPPHLPATTMDPDHFRTSLRDKRGNCWDTVRQLHH